MKSVSKILLGVALAAAAYAQPRINSGGVTNAASYVSPDLPGGAVAKGAFFVIKGANMGPATLEVAKPFPFPTALAGTSVKVTVGGSALDAYMYYTSATQVAAILPSSTPTGTGTVTVTYNGQTSATAPIRVVESALGIFTLNQGGSGPGVFQNANSGTDLPVNTLTNSARPGQLVILWGTGLGPVTTPNEAGQAPTAGDLPVNVEVYVGGQRAAVSYKGRSGCCVGLDQIIFTVPETVEGCYVPVVVKTGDIVSNFSSISVARNGGACTDVTGLTGAQLETAQRTNNFRTGNIILTRNVTKISFGGSSFDSSSDSGAGVFEAFNFDQLIRSGGVGAASGAVASAGSCTVFSYVGETPMPIDVVQPTPLNAGEVINVTNATRGAKQLTKTAGSAGVYSGQLSSGSPLGGGRADYLEPGSYTIDNGAGATGTNAVGPFRVNLTIPQLLTWTNMDATQVVNRANVLPITWQGGDANTFVFIIGAAASANGGAAFTCMERASAGKFDVPSYVLSSLPATTGDAVGLLSVNNVTTPVTFTATGLDLGTVSAAAGATKTVTFR